MHARSWHTAHMGKKTSQGGNVVRLTPTPELLESVRLCWVLGYSYSEIAAEHGCSEPQAVRLVHNHLGRAQQYSRAPSEFEEWRQLYDDQRWTYQEIAEAFKVCPGTVRFHLARVGAKIRRRGWSAKTDDARSELAGGKRRRA